MVDAAATIRAYLLTVSGLTDLVGTRIYAGDALPPGYEPADGPAVLFGVRGGNMAYHNGTAELSVNYRCYALTKALAWQTDRALYTALQDEAAPGIRQSRLEVIGQQTTEPKTDWTFVYSAYRQWLVNEV